HPKEGSWMLLGELLTSIPFPPDPPMEPSVETSCGSCRKCLDACPTGAFIGPYELDPRRCISYLTIEQPDPIPAELAGRMEGWVFGCDICQEVCPFNKTPMMRLLPEFSPDHGVGAWFGEEILEQTSSNKSFLRRWGDTPLSRPGRKGMKKNLDALKGGNAGRRKKEIEG
ncbi:4Fe-4S dicluster domain-containing protein, partial [Candidatus Sumerlaeota bacterium]|nr:4Fe-4S dicluster domain-containing protein [Candidatus Sumerlaeota bacterium]